MNKTILSVYVAINIQKMLKLVLDLRYFSAYYW